MPAKFCLSGFGTGTVLPAPFQTECATSYDGGSYGRADLEDEVYEDYDSLVTIPVVMVSRYEAYSLRECIEGSAVFTDAACNPGSSIRARFRWNRKAGFGDKFELWDSMANDRGVTNMFQNRFLRLVFDDLLNLQFKPSYFIDAGICTVGNCTEECTAGYCTRDLSTSYRMGGGDVVLEEMRRRFCSWDSIRLGNRIDWIEYIAEFESFCYQIANFDTCGLLLAAKEADINVSTSLNCGTSLPVFLNEMDDTKRQNLPGAQRTVVFNDKIIYRDTDAGNEILEFNTIMAPICQAIGSESNTPKITRACSCSIEVNPIPDFDTYNECFSRVVEEPGPPDDTATIAALGTLAVVGILFSGAAFYRTRNYRKVTEEEKMFTREEAMKMAQEFANQIIQDQKGEVGAVREDGLFAKEVNEFL